MLVQAGADPHVQDERCWTPLAMARSGDYKAVVNLFDRPEGGGIEAGGRDGIEEGGGGKSSIGGNQGEGAARRGREGKTVVIVEDEVVVVDTHKK